MAKVQLPDLKAADFSMPSSGTFQAPCGGQLKFTRAAVCEDYILDTDGEWYFDKNDLKALRKFLKRLIKELP